MTKKKVSDEKVADLQPGQMQEQESGPETPREDLVYQPMAVPEPTPLERLEAVEIRIKVLEDRVSQHNRYHFGKPT